MDRVKINLDQPIRREEDFFNRIVKMYEEDGFLYILISGKYDLKYGDTIIFKRFVYDEVSDENIVVEAQRKQVIDTENVDGNTLIKLTPFEKPLLKILFINSAETVDDYTNIVFDTNTNIFAQDIVFSSGTTKIQMIKTSLDKDNQYVQEYVDVITNLMMVENNRIYSQRKQFEVKSPRKPEEFLFNHWFDKSYSCEPEDEKIACEPMYYYRPLKTEFDSLWGKLNKDISIDTLLTENLYYNYNNFYFTDEDGICHFWEDVELTEDEETRIVRDENGNQLYNNIVVAKEIGYWRVPCGFSTTQDYVHLDQENVINTQFGLKVSEEVGESASVIDMEKVKYAPYIQNNGIFIPAESVTYNLHFRVRDIIGDGWQYSGDTSIYWNKMDSSEESEYLSPDKLVDNKWSDLLYFLGFKDGDIQNQKMKLKKTFIRLSFYDSTDMLTQKLLYYTSIFLDSGSLFGKFIKAKNELYRSGYTTDVNVSLLSSLTSNRLDCQFVVRDEFYTEKSSDGFNIYYFPDVVLDDEENNERTIYMRVDFNHAGYGRTIPMILWPNGGSDDLTLEDAKNGLYIPLKLKLIKKEENINNEKVFAYLIDSDSEYITIENNTIIFNLVEPKLTKES